jgi:CRP-like cAMP-binding protein
MDTSSILKNVAKHIRLNRKETTYFLSLLTPKLVKRNEVLVEEGGACRYIYYIQQGAFRAFSMDNKGNESTIMFAIHDWWITDIHGFILEKPAITTVQAIEDSEVLQLLKPSLDTLFVKVPAFERFFRILMQHSYIREQVRIKENLTGQAADRYRHFLAKYPQFVERVPLKQIASYLGVTPQFLSVVRRRLRT